MQDEYLEGQEWGAEWARGAATLTELRGLEQHALGGWQDLDLEFFQTLALELDADRERFPAHRSSVLPRNVFVEGLVDGALRVYQQEKTRA